MNKLKTRVTGRIMAIALSFAMVLSNMTVYAAELSAPDPQTQESVESAEKPTDESVGSGEDALSATQEETQTAQKEEEAKQEGNASDNAQGAGETEEEEGSDDAKSEDSVKSEEAEKEEAFEAGKNEDLKADVVLSLDPGKDLGISSTTKTITIETGQIGNTIFYTTSAITAEWNVKDNYNGRLKFGGAGDTTKSSIYFTPEKAGKIIVQARSGKSTETRPLKFHDGTSEIASWDTTDDLTKCEKEVEANKKYYLYSGKSGINLYYLELVYNEEGGDTPTPPTIDPSDDNDYAVTLTLTGGGIQAEDLSGAEIVFTNADDDTRSKTVTIGTEEGQTALSDIVLKNGTYTVSVYNSGKFVQQPAKGNLVVNGAAAEYGISFKSCLNQKAWAWDFASADGGFLTERYESGGTDVWFNGLSLTGVSNEKNGDSYKQHAVLGNNSVIKIPVNGNCDITVSYYYQAAGKISGGSETDTEFTLSSGGAADTVKHTYAGESGEVTISATDATYITKIEIAYAAGVNESGCTVTVNPTGDDIKASDLDGAEITFTAGDNSETKYTIGSGENQTALDAIRLEDGEYTVSVYNSGFFVQQATGKLTVNGENTAFEIPFKSCVAQKEWTWDFASANGGFLTKRYEANGTDVWFNGLSLTGVKNQLDNGKYKPHAMLGTSTIKIPVNGDCDIKVSYYYQASGKISGGSESDTTFNLEKNGAATSVTHKYLGENDTVTLSTTGSTYITEIKVTYTTPGVEDPDTYTPGIDVWDFGLEELDKETYHNKLTKAILTGWDLKNAKENDSEYWADADHILKYHAKQPGKERLYSDAEQTQAPFTDKGDTLKNEAGVATYHGYLYVNAAGSQYWFEIEAEAGDIVTVAASYNTNPAQISFFKVDDSVRGKDGSGLAVLNVPDNAQTQTVNAGGGARKEATTLKFYAAEKGTYAFCTTNATAEKLVVARVTREHTRRVAVSGTVTKPESAADFSNLVFTCDETKAATKVKVKEDGTYSVNLHENYHYTITANPTKYVVKVEDGSLTVKGSGEDASLTQKHDITVEAVSLRTLSGSIKGLDDDAKALSAVKILLKKPDNKLYEPAVTIDRTNKTYTAELENGVAYTVVTEGINDYQLVSIGENAVAADTAGTISLTEDKTSVDLTYEKKPVHKVTITAKAGETDILEELKTAGAVAKFTNLGLREGCADDKGYAYTFKLTDDISLRDGVYSVAVTKSGKYVQTLTSDLTVDGQDAAKSIPFQSVYAITEWDFSASDWTAEAAANQYYNGLTFDGSVSNNKTYALMGNGGKITIPMDRAGTVTVTFCYEADAVIGDVPIKTASKSTAKHETVTYKYEGAEAVDITASATTYIEKIQIVYADAAVPYQETITVGAGADYDYATINDALDAVRKMPRENGEAVTISIQPGDYEEMLVIDVDNIKLVNAAGKNASIALKNKGVDIDKNAVRITSYYGHGYSYYSMGSDHKWNADILAANKENGYASFENIGSGTTDGSYWNATVVIDASNVSAEGIIFENSFNQYMSKKAAEDTIVPQIGKAKEGSVPRAGMEHGDTTVQGKAYVERAAALAITNARAKISFDHCKFIGRQDTLYGGTSVTAAFYNCSVYGGTDYIMGPMTAVFAKCDLVFNTSEDKNDAGYITAAQQKSGRGYLFYNCHVTSTAPGVDTASEYTSKPGYFGRPWTAGTGEAVFYETIIDAADERWHKDFGVSLICPVGWGSGLSGESELSQEYGTHEMADVDNQSARASWATKLTEEKLKDGSELSVATFLGDWNPFAGKDMEIATEPKPPVTPVTVAAPVSDTPEGEVPAGTAVTLTSETEGAAIYYTLNGDEPSADSTLYEAPIVINVTTTIKAVAVKGEDTSEVSAFTYTVAGTTPGGDDKVVGKITASPEPGTVGRNTNVSLICETEGAAIYYTLDGSDPKTAGALYTEAIPLGDEERTVTVKAIAVKEGCQDSEPAEFVYTVSADAKEQVSAPYATPASGTVEKGTKVTLTSDTPDAAIYYTLDGTQPSAASSRYDSPIAIDADTTILAFAVKDGYLDSAVATFTYKVSGTEPGPGPEPEDPVVSTVIKLKDCEITVPSRILDKGKKADPKQPSVTYVTYTYTDASGAEKHVKFAEGLDYKAEWNGKKDGIIYTVTLKGAGRAAADGFTIDPDSSIDAIEYKVVDKTDKKSGITIVDISKAKVALKAADVKNAVYTGYAIEPQLDYSKDKDKLNGSLNIAYRNNINAGKASVIISAKPDANTEKTVYVGSKTLTFNIKKAALNKDSAKATAKVAYDESFGNTQDYTGTPVIVPGIKVTSKLGRTLKLNEDYTVTYKNNSKAGKASVTVKGIGNNLSGSWTKDFTIKSVDLTKLAFDTEGVELPYSPKGAKLRAITANDGAYALTEGVDYTAKYTYDKSKKKDAGSNVEVVISGKGAFTGKKALGKFNIVQADFAECITVPEDIAVDGKDVAKELAKAVVATDASGAKLNGRKDYKITFDKDARTVTLTPADTKNYKADSPYVGKFRLATNLAKEKDFVFKKNVSMAYDGRNPVKLTADDIKAYVNAKYELGVNIEIVPGTYKNNAKKGTASVTVRGIAGVDGGFYGTKTLKFKVVEK